MEKENDVANLSRARRSSKGLSKEEKKKARSKDFRENSMASHLRCLIQHNYGGGKESKGRDALGAEIKSILTGQTLTKESILAFISLCKGGPRVSFSYYFSL